LHGKVAFVDVSTPLTIEHYLPSSIGSGISLDVTPDRFVNMAQLEILDMKSRVPGLWLTGQDTIICGIPLAQSSGLITAARILGPFGTLRLGIRALRLLAQRSLCKK
jgi:all-trans-retinol 13,14-reductase